MRTLLKGGEKTMEHAPKGCLELLSDKNSMLVLVDYQSTMFKGVASGDKTIIRNAAYCAAKAASILSIPVVLSAINPSGNGEFMPEITRLFPGAGGVLPEGAGLRRLRGRADMERSKEGCKEEDGCL